MPVTTDQMKATHGQLDATIADLRRSHQEIVDALFILAMLPDPDDATLHAVWNLPAKHKVRDYLTQITRNLDYNLETGSFHNINRNEFLTYLRTNQSQHCVSLAHKASQHYLPRWNITTNTHRVLRKRVSAHQWQRMTRNYLNALCWCDETRAISLLANTILSCLLLEQEVFALDLFQYCRAFYQTPNWFQSESRQLLEHIEFLFDDDTQVVLNALQQIEKTMTLDKTGQCACLLLQAQQLLDLNQELYALTTSVKALTLVGDDRDLAFIAMSIIDEAEAPETTSLGEQVADQDFAASSQAEQEILLTFDNDRAYTRFDAGNFDEAIEDLNRVIRRNPDDLMAWNNRGSSHFKIGELEAAEDEFHHVIAQEPGNAAAHNNLGMIAYQQDLFDQALSHFNTAIEFDPKNAVVYDNRSIAYLRTGDSDSALHDLERALQLAPSDALIHYHWAIFHHQQKHTTQACEWLSKAIALDEKYRDMARTDPDFDAIRDAPCFLALINPE